eukprot:GILK01005076.1.p1 GENE.GILK01005076.1~~GILK01005076.1.p1  ORF type:complete len:178 (-),score=42.19 GILK01005076.1:76-609(-)
MQTTLDIYILAAPSTDWQRDQQQEQEQQQQQQQRQQQQTEKDSDSIPAPSSSTPLRVPSFRSIVGTTPKRNIADVMETPPTTRSISRVPTGLSRARRGSLIYTPNSKAAESPSTTTAIITETFKSKKRRTETSKHVVAPSSTTTTTTTGTGTQDVTAVVESKRLERSNSTGYRLLQF